MGTHKYIQVHKCMHMHMQTQTHRLKSISTDPHVDLLTKADTEAIKDAHKHLDDNESTYAFK